MRARAFWWAGPERGELRPAEFDDARFLVRSRYGALSRGTERLVAQGLVPSTEWRRMACPAMEGTFPFPVKYGYCIVGTVERGPADWLGKTVFTLHPHQDQIGLDDPAALTVIPPGLPAERAVLLANLETALNAAWDAPLLPGMKVAVVGAGVLGCLFARIARCTPGAEVVLVDRDPGRLTLAKALDVPFAQTAGDDYDLVVEASGQPAALDTALRLCGREATLLVLSWYGQRSAPLALGQAFHSRRLRLVSCQVATDPTLLLCRLQSHMMSASGCACASQSTCYAQQRSPGSGYTCTSGPQLQSTMTKQQEEQTGSNARHQPLVSKQMAFQCQGVAQMRLCPI